LGAIIAQFKPRVTKRIWKLPHMRGVPIWQRNYYEHVVRDHTDWERIHRYIETNPAMWAQDEENPFGHV
jgi:putative transposase